MAGWVRLLWAAFVLWASAAHAHELSMAELQVRELSRGEFALQWGASEKRAPSDSLKPLWPEHCKTEGNVLRCGEQGLSGPFAMKGVGQRFSAALVKIHWLDGQSRTYTLTSGQPTVNLYGAADDPRGWLDVATAYLVLGVEHILSGIDHLLFVIGLLFLVGFRRQLLWTITAFTVAHSITLALGALQLLTLRPPPVEATIALSIMLVAGEALHQRQTLSRRWPALVALLFGLVHGLGFAGALEEIGLPDNHVAVALLTFNAGVEIGQLLVLGVAFLMWHLLQRWPAFQRLRRPALYAIGSMAAYWTIARVVAIGA
jgi:hydrogenase/urease accessory protein HupE